MYTELTHTPGILYAIAYWISAMIYCRFLPKRAAGMKRCLLAALFFVLICGFMALTDHPPVYLFFLFVSIEIGMIYLFMPNEILVNSGWFQRDLSYRESN